MINPNKITNFNRSEFELQEFLLFCIVVAGKNSKIQAKKLEDFLSFWHPKFPFEIIKTTIERFCLDMHLRRAKLGQYNRIKRAFIEVSQLNDLKSVTLEQLEKIHGIGPKTARFFLLHSRPNQRYAVLDTHILKWLKSKGCDVPKNTPSKKKYAEIENIFLSFCDSINKTPSEFDLEIWNELSC